MTKLSLAESGHRIKLLLEDNELRMLHRKFVMGGVLSENEFWAPRKKLLHNKITKQRVGLKSDMCFDVKPSYDTQSNKVTLNLWAETVHKIFAVKPAVRQAYLNFVPNKMDDEFWNKYNESNDNIDAFVTEVVGDEYIEVFLKHDAILASKTREKIRYVDPTLNMEADERDDFAGFRRKGVVEAQYEPFKRSLVQDINRHSEVVLEGGIVDVGKVETVRSIAEVLSKSKRVKRLKKITRMDDMEDLQAPRQQPFVPLCIKDPRDYFNAGDHQFAVTRQMKSEAYDSLRMNFSEIRTFGLCDPIVKPEVAIKVFNKLTRNNIPVSKYQLGKNPHDESIWDPLPLLTKQELLLQWTFIQELLMHFWFSNPDTKTKVNNAMSQIYTKLQEIKESVQSDSRHQVSLIVQPMLKALDAAFANSELD